MWRKVRFVVSFPVLWQAEPEAFSQAARRWEAFEAALGGQHRELDRVTTGIAAEWEGSAQQAASAHLGRIADRMGGSRGVVEQILPVLNEHAVTVASARRLLLGAVVAARAGGLSVGPDGSVRPGAAAVTVAVLTGPAGLALLMVRVRIIAALIVQALEVATRSDQRTSARLAGLRGDAPGNRPGAAGTGRGISPGIPPAHTRPDRIARWWAGLGAAERHGLLHSHPDRIGNLDGIPVEVRDAANRRVLDALPDHRVRIAELEELGDARGEDEDQELARLRGVEALRDRLADTGPGRAYLMGFDPAGQGRAIVAVGNPDTADNVVTYVPGTGAGLHSVPGDLRRTDLMVSEADAIDPDAATSAIMWIGYEAPRDIATFPPGRGDAMDPRYAERAAPVLDSFQDGLRATHDGPPSNNTVLGHSYGSTVLGHTARDQGLDADNVIFVGSPGVGVDHVTQLGLPPERVWSSHAANDPIRYGLDPGSVLGQPFTFEVEAPTLIHGQNPSAPEFGGRVFTSEPGTPIVSAETGSWYAPWETEIRFSADAHSQYWDERSSSLENMAAIVTGRDELVY